MLLRYQCNKDRTSSFSEVMATALMLVMLLQLGQFSFQFYFTFLI